MQSMGRSELLILLPPDERLVRDLLMTKRTEKYIRQNLSLTQQDSLKRILSDKAQQNQERQAEIQQRLRDLLGKAKLIVNAADLEISSSDGQTRVIRGFHELISRAYPNRRMLRGIAYSETDIASILAQSQQGLFGNDETALAESEQEVFAFIQSNGRGGVRTTVKGLLERFERKPYGWPYPALLCTLAKLCARGKVEVRSDGNLLEDAALERALRNSQAQGNLVLEPQVQFTASQVPIFYPHWTQPSASRDRGVEDGLGDVGDPGHATARWPPGRRRRGARESRRVGPPCARLAEVGGVSGGMGERW